MPDNEAPATLAAQRETLLRAIITNSEAITVTAADFPLRVLIVVYAFMADTYAEALAQVAPDIADHVAQELADYLDDGALPEYAWDRAAELGHDPKVWLAAAEAGRLLARPADPVGEPPATADRPTAEQLDNLLGKARSRALTAAEVERLAAGLDALRDAALDAGAVRRDPLERGCPLCGARPADHCTTEQGHPARPHRARLRLAV